VLNFARFYIYRYEVEDRIKLNYKGKKPIHGQTGKK
jgi:hypothetical protein